MSGSLQSLLASTTKENSDILLKAKSEVSLSCNTFTHSLSLSCSTTNATNALIDPRERGEGFIKEKDNSTLKNSASADQISGSHNVVSLSQESKVLTSVICSSILSTKTSNTSWTSGISPEQGFPTATESTSTSAPMHMENNVPIDSYSKNKVREIETNLGVRTTTCNSYLTEQNKRMSKSLEPLNTTAMWEKSTEEVVLIKGEKGLGFSILDYQVRLKSFSKQCTL